MKQFRTILGFELANYYKNKLFVGITIFLIVAIVAVMFFPRISEAIGNDKPQEKPVCRRQHRTCRNVATVCRPLHPAGN